MDWPTLTKEYGPWFGLLVYVLLKDLIPFATKKWLPSKMKEAEDKRRTDREDGEWRKRMEEERLFELKEIAGSTRALQLNMAQTNERMATMMANQAVIIGKIDNHHEYMQDAVGQMRSAVAEHRGRAEAERRDKTGAEGLKG